MERRPHRSFRRTRRRDLPKHPPLPKYVAFTAYCVKTIRRYKQPFGVLLVLYVLASIVLVGMTDQAQYSELSESFTTIAPALLGGNFSAVEQATALFTAAITGSLGEPLGEVQQLYLGLLGILSWLVVVWYVRHRLSNSEVAVRDALYNAGAPFISTVMVLLLIVLQFAPAALAVIAYSSALSAGALAGGVEAMVFAVAAGLMVILSLYWATSSFFAALIVTIPGTYPMRAIRMAGDIVLGRRLGVMLRLLWLGFILVLWWAIILIPMIILADKLAPAWLPLVPVTIQFLSASSVLFGATYIYLLYRKMIDEPAAS